MLLHEYRVGRTSLVVNPYICYLCGLLIPDDIASKNHPLYGTIEHVIALANGGLNVIGNRFPAHRYCNELKGADSIIHPEEFLLRAFPVISLLLQKLGYQKQFSLAKAMDRSKKVWEDDGGT